MSDYVYKESLLIGEKIDESMLSLDDRTRGMKKPYKFIFQKYAYEKYVLMADLCEQANLTHGSKKTYQHKIDVQLHALERMVNTAAHSRMRLISPGLHKEWSKELKEIGCILGAWMKNTK